VLLILRPSLSRNGCPIQGAQCHSAKILPVPLHPHIIPEDNDFRVSSSDWSKLAVSCAWSGPQILELRGLYSRACTSIKDVQDNGREVSGLYFYALILLRDKSSR
jgi:hypothetical protein